jgi:hypothetical protein
MLRRLAILAVFGALLSSYGCGVRALTNPGSNVGVHNQKLLSTTIHKAIQELKIPVSQLKGKRVAIEVLGDPHNAATITGAILAQMRQTGVNIQSEDRADLKLIVGTDYAGVNIQVEGAPPPGMAGMCLPPGVLEFPWLRIKEQAYAKANLYVWVIQTASGEVVYTNTSTKTSTDNLNVFSTCCVFPYVITAWRAEE